MGQDGTLPLTSAYYASRYNENMSPVSSGNRQLRGAMGDREVLSIVEAALQLTIGDDDLFSL
jgi:hypothetical protein